MTHGKKQKRKESNSWYRGDMDTIRIIGFINRKPDHGYAYAPDGKAAIDCVGRP